MPSLHENEEFTGRSALADAAQDDVYRFCTFNGLDVEGPGFEGIVVGCTFKDSSWYWSLFNCARLVEVEFNGCIFRGCGFAGCLFVRCRFVNCKFIKDNLGGDCYFSDCAWYDCVQSECEGLLTDFVQHN